MPFIVRAYVKKRHLPVPLMHILGKRAYNKKDISMPMGLTTGNYLAFINGQE